MKYSICAQRSGLDDVSAGHETAASALAGLSQLKQDGVAHIQIFDVRTGRLIDEAALARADAQDKLMNARRPPLRPVR
ncbi:MAG: hypothetical protein IT548_11405 [Alphaproteobacteria bacterium]|nr:hypothetical protein [Alphaproteobacteria bacterium]